MAKKEMVEISIEQYHELLRAQKKLDCLEIGGVDNWCWYEDSLKDGGYFDEEEE